MKVPHPIPYQGSKRHLAAAILRYFPTGVETLYEPFAGSAAITIAAASNSLASEFVLNDFNKPLVDLWREIINHSSRIADNYAELWKAQNGQERDYYDFVRNEFNKTKRPDYLLYLLARCVKAAVRYNSNGEFNQSPDNRRRGAHPDTIKKHIFGASGFLRGKTKCLSLDYRDVLPNIGKRDLVYLDPPYQGVCGKRDPRYLQSIAVDAFVVNLSELNDKGISFILSYDGRTGDKVFGKPLPSFLNLHRVEIHAGRSSQSTLLGRDDSTYESLYISPALSERLNGAASLYQINAGEISEMEASL
ncbi:MAG: adenine methylase [Acidobacteriota bacterium]|jgi:DNA adenine methylase|nr:adenine methylase [Acidobacteriota bacterium]